MIVQCAAVLLVKLHVTVNAEKRKFIPMLAHFCMYAVNISISVFELSVSVATCRKK
jgi:hypothetical protein